jgi:hypothetical protein
MPQPLPSPFMPDAMPVLEAFRTGQADRLAAQQRGALQQAGQMAAQGSLGGARKHLLAQGMFKQADDIGQMMRQADSDQLAKVKRTYDVLGNLAMSADTPEKWAAAVGAAAKAGMDVSKYQDFGSRELVLAQSGKIGEHIEIEMKRRALEAKDAPFVFTKEGVGNKSTGEFRPHQAEFADPGDLDKGYRWRMKDGKKDLDPSGRPIAEPIPGGKAESVSSETAARVGLADKFAKDMPDLEKEIIQGTLNSVDFQLGRGKAAEVYRRIEDGAEALVRNLTGAGMNETEAKAYAERFLPGRFDMPSTKLEKLRNLGRNLQAVRNRVLVGRGVASLDDVNEALGEKPSQDSLVNEQRAVADDPLGILGN